MKVALAFPSGDFVHTDFMLSYMALAFGSKTSVMVMNAKSSLVPVGRNLLVEKAQAAKCSHILFLDSDMLFPANTLDRLLAHGEDIVCATYSPRRPPYQLHGCPVAPATEGMVEMVRVPTGCLLVRMNVFDALSKPYFTLGADSDGVIIGEDYYFSDAARAAGFKLWCDLDLTKEIGHMGNYIYKADYDGR